MADTSRLHLAQIRADLGTRRGRSKWIVLWTLATGLGWAVPAAAIITLTADLHEAAFSSFRIGLVTLVVCAALSGAAIGIAQWLILRRWATGAAWWILATIAGWIIGFVTGLVFGFFTGLMLAMPLVTVGLSFVLGPAAGLAVGGGMVGAFQAERLRRWLGGEGTSRWTLVSAAAAFVAATVLLFAIVVAAVGISLLGDLLERLLSPLMLSLLDDQANHLFGFESDATTSHPVIISIGSAYLALFGALTGVVMVRSFASVGWPSEALSERPSSWTTKEAWILGVGTASAWALAALLVLASSASTIARDAQSTVRKSSVDVYDIRAGTWVAATPTDHPVGPRGVVVGHTAYFARDCRDCDLSVIDVYDARADSWSVLQTPSPDRGTFLDLVAVDEKLVFTERYGRSSTVFVFDTHNNRWVTAEVPISRRDVRRVVVGDKLILAGGWLDDQRRATAAADVYDVATNIWRSTRLSVPRWRPDHAVIDDSVVVIAGGCADNMSNCLPADTVDVYDATSDTWTTTQLSAARFGIATAVVGTKAILAGGCVRKSHRCDQSSDRVDIFDASTKSWHSTTLPQPRYYLEAVTVGSEALFYGETDPSNCNPSDSVDIYNVTTDTWTSAKLSVARCEIAVISVGSKVIFAGGGIACQACEHPLDVVDIYESTTGAWSSTHLSEARVNVRAVNVGRTVFLAGGGLAPHGSPSSTVDIYDSVSGALSTGEMSNPRNWFWPTVVHNKVVFTGAD